MPLIHANVGPGNWDFASSCRVYHLWRPTSTPWPFRVRGEIKKILSFIVFLQYLSLICPSPPSLQLLSREKHAQSLCTLCFSKELQGSPHPSVSIAFNISGKHLLWDLSLLALLERPHQRTHHFQVWYKWRRMCASSLILMQAIHKRLLEYDFPILFVNKSFSSFLIIIE